MFALISHSVLINACLLSLDAYGDELSYWNMAIPVIVLLLCLVSSGLFIHLHPVNILSPIPWFYVACAAYFGLGPLSFKFSNLETLTYLNRSSGYAIDDYGLLQTNILNVAGILCVTIGILIGRRIFPWKQHTISLKDFDVPMAERVLWFFLIVGGGAKYFFTLPHNFGLITWVLPGLVQHLSILLTAAIIIVMLLVQRGVRRYIHIMWLLIASELVTTMMAFGKTDVLYTLIAIMIGRWLWAPTYKFIIASVVGIVLFYTLFLSAFATYGREAYHREERSSVSVLMEAVEQYFDPASRAAASDQASAVQGWWTRLTYANYQKFGLDAYDFGRPGTSLEEVYYVFVPRVLFPEKPLMGYGGTLSDLMNPGSSQWVLTAMGMFAEGYWNAGIPGLVGVCLWAGFVFAAFTKLTYQQLGLKRVGMLLICLLGMSTGMAPDYWFVPTFFGGVGEAVLYGLVIWAIFYRVTLRVGGKALPHGGSGPPIRLRL